MVHACVPQAGTCSRNADQLKQGFVSLQPVRHHSTNTLKQDHNITRTSGKKATEFTQLITMLKQLKGTFISFDFGAPCGQKQQYFLAR